MARHETEAQRLRRCREVFERSLSDRVPMPEAARRIDTEASLRRIAARAERLAEIRRTPIARPSAQPERPTPWYQDYDR